MGSMRKLAVALAVVLTISACGGSGTSDDPDTTDTTTRVGEAVGVADAIDRTRAVVEQAEDRLNTIDQLAPSE